MDWEDLCPLGYSASVPTHIAVCPQIPIAGSPGLRALKSSRWLVWSFSESLELPVRQPLPVNGHEELKTVARCSTHSLLWLFAV